MEGESPTRLDVLALYGEAMCEAQRLEEAMVGLLGVGGELAAIATEDFEQLECAQRKWERLFALTAGKLRKLLKLESELGEEVERAVNARNVLAHHYLQDRGCDLQQPAERKKMAATLIRSAERLRALAGRLDVERLRAMEQHGVTDDHVTTPAEARGWRNWDPATDVIVPPEPWDLVVIGARATTYPWISSPPRFPCQEDADALSGSRKPIGLRDASEGVRCCL